MKYSFLFLAILAVSCGDYTYNKDRVGDIRPMNASQLSTYDVQKISDICEALKKKELILNSLSAQPLTFTTSQVDCEGNQIPSETVSALIQNVNGGYGLKLANGLDFLFPTIETTNNGLLAGICNSLDNPLSPIVSGQDVVFYTTSGISSDDCETKSNEFCISVEQATAQENGTSAVVHTKEWLRVKTASRDEKFVGFVTFRKRVTKGFCGSNESQTQKATLKTE